METAGLGTTIVFVLVAVLWLAYLVPVWARRREYAATELNAVRLQQTLRIMAETAEVPEALRIEASAREVARQQKVFAKEQRLQAAIERAKAVQRARELDQQIRQVEREVRVAVASSKTRSQRLRRTRLACAVMLAMSVAAVGAGVAVAGMLPLAIIGAVVAGLCFVGLIALARMGRTLRSIEVAAERRVLATTATSRTTPAQHGVQAAFEEHAETDAEASLAAQDAQPATDADRGWTPRKLPAPMSTLRATPSAQDPMTRLREYALQRAAEDAAIAAEQRAEAEEHAAQIAPVTPLRPVVPVAPERTAAEAFLARRSLRAAEPEVSFEGLLSGEVHLAEAERREARSMAETDRVERGGQQRSRFADLGSLDESALAGGQDSLDVAAVFRRRSAS